MCVCDLTRRALVYGRNRNGKALQDQGFGWARHTHGFGLEQRFAAENAGGLLGG